jgi:hypothetical protein
VEDIGELIRRHDDYQFEVKLGYDLSPEKRKDRYAVEYFFFLPENLDVNESTYTKNQFYRDMLLYIRFMAPDLSLVQLADPSDERSPLRKIRTKLDACRADPTPYNATVLDYELKLMACILKDALGDSHRALKRALGVNGGAPPRAGETTEAILSRDLAAARRAAEGFRTFRSEFEESSPFERLRSTYAFVDEYLSLLLEGRAHQMLQALQRADDRKTAERWTPAVAGLIRDEVEYRRKRAFPSLVDPSKDNEVLVFRLSVLKKFVASALHLSVRTEKEGAGIDHLGMALGSGVAMIFYTAVAFYYQKVYGAFSLSFFLAVVVGYMFRDRIKAVAEAYFLRFRSDRVMDLSTDITDPFTEEKIGECRELVHFIPEKRVDPEVLVLRNRDHITEIENTWRSEKVLHYVKEITLFPGKKYRGSRKTALTDIARFNLRSFLMKMDEPRSDLFILRGDRSEAVAGARVYHVNLVIKFTGAARIRYERVRLVLDQDGIKRLEPVRGASLSLPK